MSRGGLLPDIVVPPPGPRSRGLARALGRCEAPGVNTLPIPDEGAGAGGAEPPIVWQAAQGANVWDVDGNRYLDLTSGFGVAAVGHRHPRVAAAVRRQTRILLHGLGDVHAHPGRIELAARLAQLAAPVLAPGRSSLPAAPETPATPSTSSKIPADAGSAEPAAGPEAEGEAPAQEPQVFFATSGAEAVEIALKTALAATGRPGIVAFSPSYHGLTLGALSVTSRPEFRAPFAAHLHPHVRRLPFGCPPEDLAASLAGPEGPAGALIVEPIVGREGVLLPPPGWLAALARLCRQSGTLLIADEILTGFGRTGSLFACQAENLQPDLLCCGKALGGGLPIAAVLASRRLFSVWSTPGEALHTSTFLANPLSCAAALAVLDVLEARHLPARANRLGNRLAIRLARWPTLYPQVATTRGRGLLWGVELSTQAAAANLVTAARRRGLLLLAGGPTGTVVQLVPPLTITVGQLNHALALLEQVLAAQQ